MQVSMGERPRQRDIASFKASEAEKADEFAANVYHQ